MSSDIDSSPAESKVIRYVRKTWATREAYEHGPSFNEDEVVDVTDEVAALRADAVKRASELHTWKETATTLRAERDEATEAERTRIHGEVMGLDMPREMRSLDCGDVVSDTAFHDWRDAVLDIISGGPAHG